MTLFDMPRWLYKWFLGLFVNKPTRFFMMRYYDVKNMFEKRKEKKEAAQKDRETGVSKNHPFWKFWRKRK